MTEVINNIFGITDFLDPDEPEKEKPVKQAPPLTGTEINIFLDDWIPY